MTPAARYAAAIGVLDAFLNGEPIEKTLSNWARRNRYAGSKDRAAVRDITFDCLRNLRSYQWASGIAGGRALAIGHCLSQGIVPADVFNGQGYAPAALSESETADLEAVEGTVPWSVESDLPDWLVEKFRQSLGAEFAATISALKNRAPVDLRVNIGKGNLASAQEMLEQDGILAEPVVNVATALRVISNSRRVAQSKAYQSGLVELQDSASQAVVQALPLEDATTILDYCAGGGGKTLAMAALAPYAVISAYDQNSARLQPLQSRACRAGISVCLLTQKPKLKNGRYDIVLIDVPCSGSGSWRRNPEGKWRLTPQKLATFCQTQKDILQKAKDFVAPDGSLAYVTCSVLRCENEDQISAYLADNPDWRCSLQQRWNLSDGGDGFFLTVLSRAKNNSRL